MLPDDITGGAGALGVKFFSCHDPSIRTPLPSEKTTSSTPGNAGFLDI
jgi:hypothetical protein